MRPLEKAWLPDSTHKALRLSHLDALEPNGPGAAILIPVYSVLPWI